MLLSSEHRNLHQPRPRQNPHNLQIINPQRQFQPQPSLQNPRYDTSRLFDLTADQQPLFDFQAEQYSQNHPLMQSEHPHNSWLSSAPLTPTSTTRAHHRESSLSSLGSAGPSSPYTLNTSNPLVAGDIYHDFHEYQQTTSKPITPAHTPSQDNFLSPHYNPNYYPNSILQFGMSQEGPKVKSELVAAPDFTQSGRPSMASVATNDSPATPPSYDEERQKNGETSNIDLWLNEYLLSCDYEVYRNTIPNVPSLSRTMTDVYGDELYNPNYQTPPVSQVTTSAPSVTVSAQQDVFSQRLQTANNQHLNANTHTPLTIPSRERSPFRHGSPLAPTANSFGPQSPNVRFGTATHMREQQKAEADARALQHQIERTSPAGATPNTVSPKDVNLIYQESEEDANTPLFPAPRQSPSYGAQSVMAQDQQLELEDDASQRSYGSMATTRRESSSAFSIASQGTQQQQNGFNFAPPAVPGAIRRVPQQYPFVPQSRRQASNLSNVTNEEFPSTLTSMESSSSEYAPETSDHQKPAGAAADTGTYTCTYHGCTLRFDTPAKLQRHKREGHRSSATMISGGDESGMTSAAQRNSQAGPHKCDRINPATGKPCNTIFSRPYDLTRHEDTIHNARKQKVHCPICTEDKTFSRNDALTRHMRVVHPQYVDQQSRRRRGGS